LCVYASALSSLSYSSALYTIYLTGINSLLLPSFLHKIEDFISNVKDEFLQFVTRKPNTNGKVIILNHCKFLQENVEFLITVAFDLLKRSKLVQNKRAAFTL
jgi:hypothetical protein